jgi:hypothetical protein
MALIGLAKHENSCFYVSSIQIKRISIVAANGENSIKGRMTVMPGKNQHVTPNPEGGWKVLAAGNDEATKVTKTKKEAVNLARKLAKDAKSELIIHGKNGRIQSKDSHGHDSFPPRG